VSVFEKLLTLKSVGSIDVPLPIILIPTLLLAFFWIKTGQ